MNSESKPDNVAAPPPDLDMLVPADLIQGMRAELAALRASRDSDAAFLSRLQQSVPVHGFPQAQVPHATSFSDFAPAESQTDPRDRTSGAVGSAPVRPYISGADGLLLPQSATGARPDWPAPQFAEPVAQPHNGASAQFRYAAPATEPPKATRFASSGRGFRSGRSRRAHEDVRSYTDYSSSSDHDDSDSDRLPSHRSMASSHQGRASRAVERLLQDGVSRRPSGSIFRPTCDLATMDFWEFLSPSPPVAPRASVLPRICSLRLQAAGRACVLPGLLRLLIETKRQRGSLHVDLPGGESGNLGETPATVASHDRSS
jgi:hypothetical protein